MDRDPQEELRARIEAAAGPVEEAASPVDPGARHSASQEFSAGIQATERETLAAVDQAAEMWGAVWEASPRGGRLHLPVLAGIRRGSILAQVEAAKADSGTELTLRVEDSAYEVNRSAVLFLTVGAVGGLSAVFWPLFPERLLPFAPLGLVMAIGAWLLVVSRLRTSGPEDFLETVAELAEEPEEAETETAPPAPLEP